MNRILLQPLEVDAGGRACLVDRRAVHLRKVLGVTPGQVVRVGLLNGPVGMATVEALEGERVTLACRWEAHPPERPRVDVLLAVPRPKVLRRLWPALASLGVGRIVLTNAEKVERQYFDTHWLAPETVRALLSEGLEQSGDTHLPDVLVRKRLKPFIEDELDACFPPEGTRRLVAHPRAATPLARQQPRPGERWLLAVGPEGGWTEYELALLAGHGFQAVGLSWRVLRADIACVALVAIAGALLDGSAPRNEEESHRE